MGRAVILMMDSFGIGGAPDAGKFGNDGADTFGHIAAACPDMKIPNLAGLGLCKASELATGRQTALSVQAESRLGLPSAWGCMREISADKDTVSGHWELAGLPNLKGWGHFPPAYPSFPAGLVAGICAEAGLDGILGNKAASGTVIIQELGEEHLQTGRPICYTSADSCFQIAAHEKHFGLEKLYRLCEIAYKHVQPYRIGRVIARPFIGEKSGEFTRTTRRRDYAAQPFGDTLLDKALAAGRKVYAVGAINDIYAHRGISNPVHATELPGLWDATLKAMAEAPDGSLVFTNFEDFDMYYGHRRNVEGYARALEYFDSRLPDILPCLKQDDVCFITADHGNDPTYKGTDHTREQVPVLMFGRGIRPRSLGQRETYADLGQTAADILQLPPLAAGISFR